jgi:hypothetical protein
MPKRKYWVWQKYKLTGSYDDDEIHYRKRNKAHTESDNAEVIPNTASETRDQQPYNC